MSVFRWIRRRIDAMRVRIRWIRTPEHLKIQASIHEAGHTLAAWVLPTFGGIMKVTVLPVGDFRGYTLATHKLSSPPEDEEIIHLMTMGMAGAAAECLLLGRSDAGSADDMIRTIGWWLVHRHGMSHATALAIGGAIIMELASDDPDRRARATAVATPPLSFAATRAIALLHPRLAELKKLAAALRRRRTLDHAGVEKVLGPRPP